MVDDTAPKLFAAVSTATWTDAGMPTEQRSVCDMRPAGGVPGERSVTATLSRRTTDSAMSFAFSPVPRQGRLTARSSVRKTDG